MPGRFKAEKIEYIKKLLKYLGRREDEIDVGRFIDHGIGDSVTMYVKDDHVKVLSYVESYHNGDILFSNERDIEEIKLKLETLGKIEEYLLNLCDKKSERRILEEEHAARVKIIRNRTLKEIGELNGR
jgi:hypothetical protein